MTCDRCRGYGLIRVNYHSGEPFDLGICQCPAGRFYRLAGEAFVRTRMQIDETHQIDVIENFTNAGDPSPLAPDFIAAGKQPTKRAKL